MTQALTLCYNPSMKSDADESTQVRVSVETRRLLKVAAAMQDVTVAELVHRLAVAELARVQGKGQE